MAVIALRPGERFSAADVIDIGKHQAGSARATSSASMPAGLMSTASPAVMNASQTSTAADASSQTS